MSFILLVNVINIIIFHLFLLFFKLTNSSITEVKETMEIFMFMIMIFRGMGFDHDIDRSLNITHQYLKLWKYYALDL